MRILGRRYDTQTPVVISLDEGRISDVATDSRIADDRLPWIGPGLIDLQVNGFKGRAFNDPRLGAEDVLQISRSLDRFGVTGYCPTATTDSFEALARMMAVVAGACEQDTEVARRVRGIHLEGPYISGEDGPRGAHPRIHVRPPDRNEFQRLQDAAGGRIRILTMSPEYPGAAPFIARLVATGVVVAIGHTNATADQIRAAVDAGARLSTHLGNGSHGQIRRHPNYIWDQLAEDRLTASLIVDGHHLPAAVVKSFVRAKMPARCILVSDVVALANLPPGRYNMPSLGEIDLFENGRTAVVAQPQLLAGAVLPITAGIANVLRFTDEDLSSAVDMASIRPAALLGATEPWLAPGRLADLAIFRLPGADRSEPIGELEVIATINAGRLVFGELPV